MVGIFNWYGIPRDFEHRIKAIKKAGFESTFMWIDDDGQWEIDPETIPHIIRDNGLVLEYAHAPYSRINTLWDRYKTHDMERELEKHIDYCFRHLIPILVIHLTKGFRVKEANKHGLEALRRIVKYANDKNVSIAAENTKQNKVLETVFDTIKDKTLGLCFDTSHDNLYGDPKFKIMEKYHNRILCFHISDNDGKSDDHWPPYQGKVDWEDFVLKFPKAYNGILNLEVLPKDKGIEEESFLHESYRVIKDIENRIGRARVSAAVD
jgi:Sugar phosphate isomerases/epimerases